MFGSQQPRTLASPVLVVALSAVTAVSAALAAVWIADDDGTEARMEWASTLAAAALVPSAEQRAHFARERCLRIAADSEGSGSAPHSLVIPSAEAILRLAGCTS